MVLGEGVTDLCAPWSKCCLNQYVPRKLEFVHLCVDFYGLRLFEFSLLIDPYSCLQCSDLNIVHLYAFMS